MAHIRTTARIHSFLNRGKVFVEVTLAAQLPTYWVPVFKSLFKCTLSITQRPTIWVPGLLGLDGMIVTYRSQSGDYRG